LKILILGSEGFIGKHLVTFFLHKNYTVFGCDLFEVASQSYNYIKVSRLSPEFQDVFASREYNVCINAAGSGNVNYSMTHPVSDFEANALDTMRVLDNIKTYQPACRYLHLSSAAVYGNPQKLPVTENDKLQPLSPYGWHKLIAENICKEYTSVYGLSTAALRPFSVYGPYLQKQLLWDMFVKFKNSNAEQGIVMWGTGKESRDFIYIDDLVLAVELVIKHGAMQANIYNVATGNEVTIATIVKVFQQYMFGNYRVTFNEQVREGDPLNWRADISAIAQLGFKPSISLDNGIQKLTTWLKSLL
jgi:UDP-glucose 4-epimerase